jgi:UTP-glucose-1-phosphate uridylyltransferase
VKHSVDGSIIFVGSRNFKAPGPGASAYSCSKAALTQLCRVAALELAPYKIRVNIVHPDAVFDTKLWTPEALQKSATRYGMTVEEYKTKNLMKVEIKSKDIGNMVAAMEVPPEKASSYGVLDIGNDMGSVVEAKGMVEKPPAGTAPSNLAVIGRYILSPDVLTNLNKIKQGAGGEIQLTDAIAEEIGRSKVYGYRFRGQRYDCGSKAGFLQATVAFGMARPELHDEFSAFLNDILAMQKAAQ